jgi:hypothetical protein
LLVFGPLLSCNEAGSAARLSEVLIPRVAKARHLGGYLIGDLGTRTLRPTPCLDVQISTGYHSDPVTMLLRCVRVALGWNLWFPGLRRFREERCRPLSQLLQIATLAYI